VDPPTGDSDLHTQGFFFSNSYLDLKGGIQRFISLQLLYKHREASPEGGNPERILWGTPNREGMLEYNLIVYATVLVSNCTCRYSGCTIYIIDCSWI
jgi:hypothetical protein